MASTETNKQPRRSFPIQSGKDKIAENWGRWQGDVGERNLTSQVIMTAKELLLNEKLIGK